MKHVFLLICLLVAVSSQANTVQSVFAPNTPLPAVLQQELLSYIEKHCPQYLAPGSLYETSTTFEEGPLEGGMDKVEYNTALISSVHLDPDHYASTEYRFYAETVRYNLWDVAPRYEVLHVAVEGKDCK